MEEEKTLYLFESHMGGYFWADEEIEPQNLYCDEWGDSDWFVGEANTKEEAEKLAKEYSKEESKEIVDEFVKIQERSI